MNEQIKEKIAELVYEATRMEAEWSNRRIVPEPWQYRDEAFRTQFINIVHQYMEKGIPTPEEAHDSWMKKYFEMGWVYGEVRDAEKKTHPDLVPYNELPQDEKDKDAIFLAFVWLGKQILDLPMPDLDCTVGELIELVKDCPIEYSLSSRRKGTKSK